MKGLAAANAASADAMVAGLRDGDNSSRCLPSCSLCGAISCARYAAPVVTVAHAAPLPRPLLGPSVALPALAVLCVGINAVCGGGGGGLVVPPERCGVSRSSPLVLALALQDAGPLLSFPPEVDMGSQQNTKKDSYGNGRWQNCSFWENLGLPSTSPRTCFT